MFQNLSLLVRFCSVKLVQVLVSLEAMSSSINSTSSLTFLALKKNCCSIKCFYSCDLLVMALWHIMERAEEFSGA